MPAKQNATLKHTAEPPVDKPLTDDEFRRGYTAMLARKARRATGLSQKAFAARYGIPAASLRDWEQGRRTPPAAVQSYLRVIARMPEDIAKALDNVA